MKSIEGQLDLLEKLDFLNRKEGKHNIYYFKSKNVEQSVYNRMLFDQRQKLHLDISEYLEKLNADLHLQDIARHLWKHLEKNEDINSQILEKSMNYIFNAAQDLSKKGNEEGRIKWFERAVASLNAENVSSFNDIKEKWMPKFKVTVENKGNNTEVKRGGGRSRFAK